MAKPIFLSKYTPFTSPFPQLRHALKNMRAHIDRSFITQTYAPILPPFPASDVKGRWRRGLPPLTYLARLVGYNAGNACPETPTARLPLSRDSVGVLISVSWNGFLWVKLEEYERERERR